MPVARLRWSVASFQIVNQGKIWTIARRRTFHCCDDVVDGKWHIFFRGERKWRIYSCCCAT